MFHENSHRIICVKIKIFQNITLALIKAFRESSRKALIKAIDLMYTYQVYFAVNFINMLMDIEFVQKYARRNRN